MITQPTDVEAAFVVVVLLLQCLLVQLNLCSSPSRPSADVFVNFWRSAAQTQALKLGGSGALICKLNPALSTAVGPLEPFHSTEH